MNRLGVIVLLIITASSGVLGAVAASANYRILPYTPIVLRQEQETNATTPRVDQLKIGDLTTVSFGGYPDIYDNSSIRTQFRQGDVLGIFFKYSILWDKPSTGLTHACGENEYEHVYVEGELSANFSIVLRLYESNGEFVASTSDDIHWIGGGGSSSGISDVSRRRYAAYISHDWATGVYILEARVDEHITGIWASEETTIEILAAPPPEEKHPSPISADPEDLVIGVDDLPDGWSQRFQAYYPTFMASYLTYFHRSFNKTVGNLTGVKDFVVVIKQFENVDEARKYYDSHLEDALESERLGDSRKVYMQDIGDGGYLRDIAERRTTEWSGWNITDPDGNPISWATGSAVTFIKENIIVTVGCSYNYEGIRQGVYVTNEELIEFATIQEGQVSS